MPYCQFGNNQNQRRADEITYIKHNFVQRSDRSRKARVFTVAQCVGKEASLKQSLGRALVASIGPVCSAALRKLTVRVDIEAKPPKLGPLIEAINVALSNGRPLGKS